jgi:hypothetical protein
MEWTIRWWQWLLSVSKAMSPAFDLTGKYANLNQTDRNVFFLCQTFGKLSSTPIRKVVIHNRAIFMPIINWISVIPDDGCNDEQLLEAAGRKIDVVESLQLFINHHRINVDLEKYRVRSFPFEVSLPKENLLDLKEGPARCASDGYWVLFESVKQSLALSSYGSCSLGVNRISMSYTLYFV